MCVCVYVCACVHICIYIARTRARANIHTHTHTHVDIASTDINLSVRLQPVLLCVLKLVYVRAVACTRLLTNISGHIHLFFFFVPAGALTRLLTNRAGIFTWSADNALVGLARGTQFTCFTGTKMQILTYC